jgi:NAD(P)-dependent dehydrogenase (short-subunit alcohol dehydrogenase family)
MQAPQRKRAPMALNPRITDWNRLVVWLVGASSGIGRATASRLHGRGAQVIVSARSTAALADFEAAHPGGLGLPLDVTDAASVKTAAASIVARHGRLDVVLHCAGHYRAMRATAFDLADALRHNQVNYVGALHLLDAVLPQLLAQRAGHLSLVASVAGYRGLPTALAYGPTKAALINMAEALWLDLEPLGIGVSIVNPGFVATPLTSGNAFEMPALIGADEAARHIVEGWADGDFEIHFPKRFTRSMKALSHLGDSLYFRRFARRSTCSGAQRSQPLRRK